MKRHQFKPFDKVLVRDYDDDPWRAMHYSHFNNEHQRHYCASSYWNQCIPYNENTAHLVGTNEPYKEPEPKVWKVKNTDTGACYEFTQNQFEHFIKNVLDNKKYCAYSIHLIN